jgi:hypothetical protein
MGRVRTGNRLRIGVLLAVVGLWLFTVLVHQPPKVDQALAEKVLPVIDAHLQGGKWFCTERVIEIRQQDDELRVGLDTSCQEYFRSGNTLVAASGQSSPKLVTLAGGPDRYEVRRVQSPLDGAGYSDSVRRMFSAAGYTEVRRSVALPDPAVEARQEFGLPPDAPVRLRSYNEPVPAR